MGIVLEGMDGSGKSTLAKNLLQYYPTYKLIHPGAPPKDLDSESKFLYDQHIQLPGDVIYDRVTCISQQVYRKKLFDIKYMQFLHGLIINNVTIIYCRPPKSFLLDMNNNTIKAHDTPEMINYIRKNANLFVESYDCLMSAIPHITYDYTKDDLQQLISILNKGKIK